MMSAMRSPRQAQFQFSLRGLLALTLFAALIAATLGALGRELAVQLAGELLAISLIIVFLAAAWVMDSFICRVQRRYRLVLLPCLYFALAFALHFAGGVLDSPHPRSALAAACLAQRAVDSVSWGFAFALLISILIPLEVFAIGMNSVLNRTEGAFYPRLSRLRALISHLGSRLVAMAGFAFLTAYYVWTATMVYRMRSGHFGPAVLPEYERILFFGMAGWASLWIAECLSRPRGGTLGIAMLFLLVTIFMLEPSAFHMLQVSE
jgi:hypothetical protein